jgi:hypothetical protein
MDESSPALVGLAATGMPRKDAARIEECVGEGGVGMVQCLVRFFHGCFIKTYKLAGSEMGNEADI